MIFSVGKDVEIRSIPTFVWIIRKSSVIMAKFWNFPNTVP